MKMNIVFFGSSQFAVPSLKALVASKQKVSCVVTQPDRQKGRGLALAFTPIKRLALENNLNVYQPQEINYPQAIKTLKSFKPDLFVVIAYGQILSAEILNIPKVFCINLHASLLPKYRGAAPINWAIIKGERATGITVMKMAEKMDAGPIILQKSADIKEEDNALTLEDRLSILGAGLLTEVINSIEDNNYKLLPQDKNKVSFAPKLQKQDGLIDWDKPARDICNLARGCLNWPGAFTYYKGKLLKVYKARVSSQVRKFASSPGEIMEVNKNGITVVCGGDDLVIQELQIEGKRRMKIEEFIAGHKICPGEILDKKITRPGY